MTETSSLFSRLRTAVEVGDGSHFELRLFRALCVAGAAFMFGAGLPANILEGRPLFTLLNGAIVAFGVVALVLLRLSRDGAMFPMTFWLALVALINVAWFRDGGSMGSVGYFFFAAYPYAMIFFRGRQRLAMVGVFVANCLTLLTVEFLVPGSVVVPQGAGSRFIDLMVGVFISAIAIYLMLWVVLKVHDGERQRLDLANRQLADFLEINSRRAQELEDTLAELRELRQRAPAETAAP